jgi:alkylation response protein AidB-like acyl-CoA dehydrogenase
MDPGLSEEHVALRQTLRRFFEKEAPTDVVHERDRTETFPSETYQKMADLGLCGMTIPEEFGGTPLDEVGVCIVCEEAQRAAGHLCWLLAATSIFSAKGINQFGSAEQRAHYLPRIADGSIRFAMSLSEPDSGSDLGSLRSNGTRTSDGWRINGQKVFSTGADTADYLFALVRTDPEATGSRGLTAFLIPTTAPGVTIRPLRKLAGQAVHTCEIFLDDVEVPDDAVLGDPSRGAKIVFTAMDADRISCGAMGLGIAQGALDVALRYATERKQFKQPIIDFQAIGHMLADMAMDVEAARHVIYDAARVLDSGGDVRKAAAMAKIIGTEVGTRNALRGMQILGGYSYMVEYPMERYYRESKLYEIVAGTNQILRNVLVSQLKQDVEGRR